jgi:hypothetical protein
MSGLSVLFGMGAAGAGGTAAAFGGATAGASILSGSIGAAALPTVGAGIGIGSAAAATGGTLAALGSGVMSVLPFASMALTGLSSVMGAKAQMQSGDAALQAAEYNAQVNEYNAKMMEDQAEAVKLSTDYKVQQEAKQHRRFLSFQKSRYAKSGVVVDSGSPLLNLNETAYLSAMDRFMTEYAGDLEATTLRNKANVLRSNAGFVRYQGDVAKSTADYSATGTLLSGLGKMGSTYFSRTGTYRDYFG